MERKLKEELNVYFETPKPIGKQKFLRQFGVKKIALFPLIVMQIKYMSKWVWASSVFFCGMGYGILEFVEPKYFSMILALTPFLVMLSVTDSMCSYRYGMEELESSARFSLKSIVMARLLIVGFENLLVLMIMAELLNTHMEFHAVYIFVPYFITAGGSLYIVRNIRGNESVFFCCALAVFVCGLQILLPWQYQACYLPEYLPVWTIICIIGIFVTIKESYRTIRMTEELAWN